MLITRKHALSLEEPAIDWRWFVYMPPVEGITIDVSKIVAENVSFPFRNVQSQPRFLGGTYKKYPGMSEVENVDISFYENHKFSITSYLEKWRKLIYDSETGIYGMPVNYKKDIYLEIYDSQGNLGFKGILIGARPTGQNNFDLDYTSGGRLNVTASFAIDNTKNL